MIRIDDLQHVVIDGDTVGDVSSACCNYPKYVAEIQVALVALVDATLKAADEAAQVLIDAATADRDKAIEDLRLMTADRDSNVKQNTALKAGQIAYLSGSTEGQQVIRDFNLQLTDDAIAALQQRRAALTGSV